MLIFPIKLPNIYFWSNNLVTILSCFFFFQKILTRFFFGYKDSHGLNLEKWRNGEFSRFVRFTYFKCEKV